MDEQKRTAVEIGKIQTLKKFYTAFVFFAQDSNSHNPIQLHCTHKYLGVQTPLDMRRVSGIITRWFNQKPTPKFPLAVFNEEAFFGMKRNLESGEIEGKQVRVLKSFIHADVFWPELRKQLGVFKEDEYPDYQPHITIDYYPSVTGIFQAYAIMTGEQIVLYWRNAEWEAREKEEAEKLARLAARRGRKNPLQLMD